MATVHVNGKPVDIGTERLNVIQAAEKGGVFVPSYCWHPALTVVASCRMCLVEIGEMKDGKPVMLPGKVVPGCQTPVKDGTVIVTDSKRVKDAQGQVLEGLLLNHPLDCPVCDKAGECKLQDYSYQFGHAQSRMIDDKNTPPNKPDLGENVALFTDRCIMCSRCVRFTREISGEAELQLIHRGSHAEVDIFPGIPLDNKLSTNVVDLCPVGALCSKDFLYKHRVWNLKTVQSVCPDCSTGCSINLDGDKSIVYRLHPRENPQAQGYFMCDDGRLGYGYINSVERFRRPLVRKDGKAEPKPWPEVVTSIRKGFAEVARKDAGQVIGVLSPFMTCEEAYLLAKFLKGLSKNVQLALGPVPVVGQDDTYPKDRRGQPSPTVKFTIRSEKCPNRKGVEAVLRHFQGDVIGFDDVTKSAAAAKVKALYLAAGYPPRPGSEFTENQAKALGKVPLLVCHDLLPSPVSALATYILPGASFAEKDGTFVNHAGLAQALHWGATPTGEGRTDGQVFLDLLERRGLVHVPTLRKELAAEIPAFAPLAAGELGQYGIHLEKARYSPRLAGGGFIPRTRRQAGGYIVICRTRLRNPMYLDFSFWITLIFIAIVVGVLQGTCAYLTLLERKIAAWAQDRIGPNRVGPLGLLQPLVDGIKFLLKEEVIPARIDRLFYLLAPAISLAAATLAFAVVPFGQTTTPPELIDYRTAEERPIWPQTETEMHDVLAADKKHAEQTIGGKTYPERLEAYNADYQFVIAPHVDIGVVWVFAISSLAVYAIVLGGWASNNKYSFLGALRSSAQFISYEIPLGMSVLGVMLMTGSLNLERILGYQYEHGWNFLFQPLACLLFIVSVFAECNRVPFDLPECEQELVGGYHTEYSALKFGLFMLGEYTHMITTSFLVVIVFFGGWLLPGITDPHSTGTTLVTIQGVSITTAMILKVVVLGAKMVLFILFFMLVRWTIPRFRFDQLMALAWKVMMPLALASLVCVLFVKYYEWNPWCLLPTSFVILIGTAWFTILLPKAPGKVLLNVRGPGTPNPLG